MTRALRILGILAVLTLVATLLGIGSASAGEDTTDPMTGAPAVGSCYDLTLKQASRFASPEGTVDCTRRHTLVVSALGALPASLDWATIDQDQFPKALSRAIVQTCDPAADKILGSNLATRYLSLYSTWFFAPTKAQVADGARWFTCAIGLSDSARMLPLSNGRPSRITKPVSKDVARCVNSRYDYVACSRTHSWRATSAFIVEKKLTKRTERAAGRRCARQVATPGSLVSVRSQGKREFVAACYTKTRH